MAEIACRGIGETLTETLPKIHKYHIFPGVPSGGEVFSAGAAPLFLYTQFCILYAVFRDI